LGFSQFFFAFTTRISEQYESLFDGADAGSSTRVEANFANKWGTYQTIYTLAGGRLIDFDAVTKLPLHSCLTFLAYLQDRSQVEHILTKQTRNQLNR
jgi:hypothetical protein